MNLETILDEVAQFNENLFKNTLDLIDANLDFIEENQLLVPKTNYLFAIQYINNTIRQFSNLDKDFLDGTLLKIHRDINNLFKLYTAVAQSLENNTKYKTKFLQGVKLLKEIKNYTQEFEIENNHYEIMYYIYEVCYANNFIEQKKHIINSFKTIINTKLLYLDTLMWIEAVKSEHIFRYFKTSKIDLTDGINSKKYIQHRQKVDLPYTDEYAYLTKCLRIYE